jgi:hypothetical protein
MPPHARAGHSWATVTQTDMVAALAHPGRTGGICMGCCPTETPRGPTATGPTAEIDDRDGRHVPLFVLGGRAIWPTNAHRHSRTVHPTPPAHGQ